MNDSTATDLNQFTPKLTQMTLQPFGILENGSTVEGVKANLVITATNYMKMKIRASTEETLPESLSQSEKESRIQEVVDTAMNRLVSMLNQAIPDERYHVTTDYLLTEGHNYSTEFWLFVVEYCRVISRDPDFYVNQGSVGLPTIVETLFRPLTTKTVFQILPQIAQRFVKTNIEVVEVNSNSARVRWYGYQQEDPVLNEIQTTISTGTWKSILCQVPTIYGRPPAEFKEITSILTDGTDYSEWELTWENPPNAASHWLIIGIGFAAVWLFINILFEIPPYFSIALSILFPLYLGWSLKRFSQLEREQDERESLLQEQQKLAAEQYDESQETKARLQNLNIELRSKVDELTTLHEISAAVSATLDLDDLIEKSLLAVTKYLHYDRAMVMIVDHERGLLTRAKGVGDSPELIEYVSKLEFPLDEENHFIRLLNSDEPILLPHLSENASETNRELFNVLQTQGHLGTPLISKGRRVGILEVDNSISGRPIADEEIGLVFNVAGQIAVAIENAQLYQQVEAQKNTLEQRVKQRTAELAKAVKEAEEARAQAEEANELKSSFLSSVSHELRTPLTSVLGFATVIQRGLEKHIFPQIDGEDKKAVRTRENVREEIGIIIAESQRLTNLVNDVLDLAKIEAGQMEWKEQEVNMVEVIDRSVKATTSLINDNGLAIDVDVPSELPIIQGDQDRLVQVVINLLSNAIKFTSEGEITCKAHQNNGEIHVSVRDTGIGISEEDISKTFEKFRQVGDTLTEKPRGTGLGLPICKEIIEHHKGRIWAESVPGEGSTFHFTLPVS